MQPVPPFWFAQRQGKLEPAGPEAYRLTAPNAPEAFVRIQRADNGLWSAALRRTAEGPDVAATEAVYELPQDAWNVAFELHRTHLIV
jgi:hypothetical protein